MYERICKKVWVDVMMKRVAFTKGFDGLIWKVCYEGNERIMVVRCAVRAYRSYKQ